MAILVAGVFQHRASADEAMDSLRRAGFGEDDVRQYHTWPADGPEGVADAAEPSSAEAGSRVRPHGIVIVVNASVAADIDLMIDLMRECGACFVERDHGEWRDGQWVDFDPDRPPETIEIDVRRAMRPASAARPEPRRADPLRPTRTC
jgi:hypothetical protein